MELGLHYANFSHPDWQHTLEDRLAETVRLADEGGVALVTVMDHWFQMENLGGPSEPMLEGYTTLGYLAAITSNVRLRLLVTGVTYRHPGLLAKTVTTVDRLSRGRAMLGLGAAWYEREHLGLGVPFPPMVERFERLEETLQICRQLWSTDDGPYDGQHYRLAETICVPPPYQRPTSGGPPIMIGGSGERKTLRLVARYADACNLFGRTPEEIAHKLDVLRRHCDDVGRDYDEITKTMIGTPAADGPESPDDFLRRMKGCADVGIDLVTVVPSGDDPVAWTEDAVANLVPRLAEL
ncbi:MAG: LLM class F420-dependent oxidoreductase [Nocardioidaceae bacterium]|nr:LLM class F420-dependent oxidoreductase [Nocardioidaceae bacterium]